MRVRDLQYLAYTSLFPYPFKIVFHLPSDVQWTSISFVWLFLIRVVECISVCVSSCSTSALTWAASCRTCSTLTSAWADVPRLGSSCLSVQRRGCHYKVVIKSRLTGIRLAAVVMGFVCLALPTHTSISNFFNWVSCSSQIHVAMHCAVNTRCYFQLYYNHDSPFPNII